MSLTEQDRIECREIAREIVAEVLRIHIEHCPHHQAYLIGKARLIGIGLGIVLASSVGSGTAATVVTLILRSV